MATIILAKPQRSIFLLILFFTIFSFSTSLAITEDPSDEVFSKFISPSSLGLTKREKLSHLHFYLHDIVSGKNATVIRVAGATNAKRTASTSSPFSFGSVYMIDDPLTMKPDINSTMVGRAQGLYSYASQSELSLLMVLNFAFTHGKFNGSTLSVLGRNNVLSTVREMPILGGSGVFRFARGYAQAKTYSINFFEAIVEYNIYVFHY
ncbi:Plant disease resistance response protein [Corchorus capsularis]|uniref:Dirigent protein n=1 Tax=Corchorus capsularis TaxID=210143 RepID=A0A1R3HRZ9_COCAP|nr:Plant disease resistance response protein [Corchorus capsularis]